MTRIAFVFPGQAAQRPGMASAWAETPYAENFTTVGRAAGVALAVLADDSEACAASTAIAQPAIYAASLAAFDALVDAGVLPDVVAGHSLGEVTAATAAGLFAREDAARVVVERGRAMADACAATPGAMAAAVRIDEADVAALIRPVPDVAVANLNAPGQTVLTGDPDRLHALAEPIRERGGRLLMLDVEGAFHSSAMTPAMVRLDAALRRTELATPIVPVVSGTDGLPRTTSDSVRAALVDGVLAPVRWIDVQHALAALADVVIEVGPGGILQGCAKRTIPATRFFSVSSPQDVAAVVAGIDGLAPAAHATAGGSR